MIDEGAANQGTSAVTMPRKKNFDSPPAPSNRGGSGRERKAVERFVPEASISGSVAPAVEHQAAVKTPSRAIVLVPPDAPDSSEGVSGEASIVPDAEFADLLERAKTSP